MDGWNSISRGNSSSLPANISNVSTHFENGLKMEKLPVGPTSSSPGPMLLMVAATAVKFVTKSFPSNEIANTEAENRMMNVMKYTLMERTTSCSTGFPSTFIFLILFGWI